MSTPPAAFFILFVSDPTVSAGFYRDLLGSEPVESSPTFAMFELAGGARLGLWSPTTAEPPVTAGAGASEICLIDPDVDGRHAAWAARGIPIMQPPTDMEFGRTFVAADPDGHRVRVFFPAEAA